MNLTIESGVFAMLVLELVKRAVWFKYPKFEFTKQMYTLIIPTLAFLCGPLLAYLGYADYVIPADFVGFITEAVRILIGSLVAVLVYNNTLKSN